MPKFVIYEVWTDARVIEADSYEDALIKGEPEAREDLTLSNWHAKAIDGPLRRPTKPGLNYRQDTYPDKPGSDN